MRKYLLGLFLIVAILTTGCLGDAPTQIIGTWRYVPVNPFGDDVYWTFQDDGQIFIYDATTLQSDTGTYEMYMNGTHRMFKIEGTSIVVNSLYIIGEWYIVSIDFDNMIAGTKDQGGFQQRDFTKQ